MHLKVQSYYSAVQMYINIVQVSKNYRFFLGKEPAKIF